MKTKMSLMKPGLSVTVLAVSMLFATVTKAQQPVANQQGTYSITGNATAGQLVPAGTATGTGTITGTYDPSTHLLNYTSTWDNLSGAPSSAGFYNGASGANGKILGDPWSLGSNVSKSGNTSGKVTLTDEQASSLLAGNWYYTYATSTATDGEIRGQIVAKKP